MKKLTLLLACIMVFASIASVCVSAAGEVLDVTYTAVYAATAPSIDGVVDEAWDAAPAEFAAGTYNGNLGTTVPPTFKVMHDDKYIYVLMQYTDLNGTKEQKGFVDGVAQTKGTIGGETAMFAFIDSNGKQNEFMFTSAAITDGAVSMNVWRNIQKEWKENPKHVEDNEEGFRGVSLRDGDNLVWEMRILKGKLGVVGETMKMDVFLQDSGDAGMLYEAYCWSMDSCPKAYDHVLNASEVFGTLILSSDTAITEPVDTEPVETEPVTTEPVETEPVETEPVETEPVEETEPVTTDEAPATTGGSNALTYVLIAVAAVVVIAVVVVVIAKAKKKAK